jgi:hypothetical protein
MMLCIAHQKVNVEEDISDYSLLLAFLLRIMEVLPGGHMKAPLTAS